MYNPPRNERLTRYFAEYAIERKRLDWEFIQYRESFPDATMRLPLHGVCEVEFEYRAANFIAHRHDPAGCRVIVCWIDDWPGRLPKGLYTIALSELFPENDPIWEDWPCYWLAGGYGMRKVHFYLSAHDDAALLAWLDSQEDPQETIKVALRGAMPCPQRGSPAACPPGAICRSAACEEHP